MSVPYCGKCHRWLDDGIPGRKEGTVCNCRSPDLTKDPNCHNSGHDHYDPESPIVKMYRQVADLEDAIDEGRAHEWLDYGDGQFCAHCDMDAADLEGDAWIYCPARPVDMQPSSPKPTAWPPLAAPDYWRGGPQKTRLTSLDDGYDAQRINWSRLFERILASTYNAIFYGSLLILAKALGIL